MSQHRSGAAGIGGCQSIADIGGAYDLRVMIFQICDCDVEPQITRMCAQASSGAQTPLAKAEIGSNHHVRQAKCFT